MYENNDDDVSFRFDPISQVRETQSHGLNEKPSAIQHCKKTASDRRAPYRGGAYAARLRC